MGETPPRFIRIPDPLWGKAVKKTKLRGTNVSEVIRTLLEQYVESDDSESDVAQLLNRIAADLNTLGRLLEVKISRH